jgi:putative aldouronate transport system permease protein
MYGAQIAFRDYYPGRAISESSWVGLKHFTAFFESFQFSRVMWNTIALSLGNLIFGYPLPIFLAIGLQYVRHSRLRKFSQLVTYAPYFISTIVVAGILLVFLSPRTGPVNVLLKSLGHEPIFFMGDPSLFRSVYIGSSIWQFTGYNAIIYIAVLSNVSPELHEAATIEGASKPQRIVHVDFPVLLPTATVLFILALGRTLRLGFEKAYALQNSLNLSTSEVVQTYVYKLGLLNGRFSYAAAVGLFINVINFAILLIVNKIAKRTTSYSLF